MPSVPEALQIAKQALDAGDRAQAQFVYERIVQAAPWEHNALNALGVLALQAGQWDVAEGYIQRAIASHAADPAYHNNLNLIYRGRGRHEEAVACCRRALELDSSLPELHNNLGIELKEVGALEEAAASLQRAVQLRPDYADAHYNLGNTLADLHRLEAAETAYRRAIDLAPRDSEPHNNLGAFLQLQGRFAEAMDCFETALRCNANSVGAHRNRALLRLLLGDYLPAWSDYEWRWQMPDTICPNFSQPRWQGQRLDGRTILLWTEQGIGDVVQFIRYAPLVKQSGARVLVDCSPALQSLLRSAPGIDQFVSGDTSREPFDCYIPLLSLPSVFGTTVETIPGGVPYLRADEQRVQRWRSELSGIAQFKVGIAWQGNPRFSGDYYRSVRLEQFAPIAACRNVKLYSLQKNFGREQLADVGSRMSIVDLGAVLDENSGPFIDTVAVMMNLDLVITTDTAVAHVAGALGVPVWVALQYSPNWRWMLQRDDSPWYPTMRLFRQPAFGDWDGAFASIASQLELVSTAMKR